MYKDPWRGQSRALERAIVKLRAMQTTLILHYSEEIRRTLIDTIRATDKIGLKLKSPGAVEQLPDRTKDVFNKALSAWKKLGALDSSEALKIKELVAFRNDIAHRIWEVNQDLSSIPEVKWRSKQQAPEGSSWMYTAPDEMRAVLSMLDMRIRKHHLVKIIHLRNASFDTTSKTLTDEIQSLKTKIGHLAQLRQTENDEIFKDLKAIGKSFKGNLHPAHPLQVYKNGRLTKRGEEICYRLFDIGYGLPTIAYAMSLSLRAVRHRRKLWKQCGGIKRKLVKLNCH